MAKTLIAGQEVTNQYGDVWDEAVLVVDQIQLDFLNMNFKFRVDVYKNAASRTGGMKPISDWHVLNQSTFMANFDPSLAATTLKSQSEDYALTMVDPVDGIGLLYGGQFE
jgi:hypothetical protein